MSVMPHAGRRTNRAGDGKLARRSLGGCIRVMSYASGPSTRRPCAAAQSDPERPTSLTWPRATSMSIRNARLTDSES